MSAPRPRDGGSVPRGRLSLHLPPQQHQPGAASDGSATPPRSDDGWSSSGVPLYSIVTQLEAQLATERAARRAAEDTADRMEAACRDIVGEAKERVLAAEGRIVALERDNAVLRAELESVRRSREVGEMQQALAAERTARAATERRTLELLEAQQRRIDELTLRVDSVSATPSQARAGARDDGVAVGESPADVSPSSTAVESPEGRSGSAATASTPSSP